MDYPSIEFMQALFELEREIREAPDTDALAKVITVRSQAVLGFKDAVFCAGSSARKMRAQAASNSDLVDPSSPVLTWVEELCALHSSQLENGSTFVASADSHIQGKNLLPKHVLFVPLQSKNQGLLGCLVFTRTAKVFPARHFIHKSSRWHNRSCISYLFQKTQSYIGHRHGSTCHIYCRHFVPAFCLPYAINNTGPGRGSCLPTRNNKSTD